MSDQRQFGWKSGRLISSPLARFWQPPATLDDADPQVPSLPLLTATVAATAGIIALAFGYFEHAPEAELDSYVGTVIEQPAAPATHEAVVYYVLGEAIEAEDIEDSVSQPLPDALLAPAGDYIAQVWTDLEPEQGLDAYVSLLALNPHVCPAGPAAMVLYGDHGHHGGAIEVKCEAVPAPAAPADAFADPTHVPSTGERTFAQKKAKTKHELAHEFASGAPPEGINGARSAFGGTGVAVVADGMVSALSCLAANSTGAPPPCFTIIQREYATRGPDGNRSR